MFNVSVSMSGAVGLGVGVGSYQSGVYVPLKALFLVFSSKSSILCSLIRRYIVSIMPLSDYDKKSHESSGIHKIWSHEVS